MKVHGWQPWKLMSSTFPHTGHCTAWGLATKACLYWPLCLNLDLLEAGVVQLSWSIQSLIIFIALFIHKSQSILEKKSNVTISILKVEKLTKRCETKSKRGSDLLKIVYCWSVAELGIKLRSPELYSSVLYLPDHPAFIDSRIIYIYIYKIRYNWQKMFCYDLAVIDIF